MGPEGGVFPWRGRHIQDASLSHFLLCGCYRTFGMCGLCHLWRRWPHTQPSFSLCNTRNLAGRYCYSHFTEGEIEAPQGDIQSHRPVTGILKFKPQPSCPLAWVCRPFCRRLPASPCSGPAGDLLKFHHHFWFRGEGSQPVIFALSGSLEHSEVRGGAGAGARWQGGVGLRRRLGKAGWRRPLAPRGAGSWGPRAVPSGPQPQARLLPARSPEAAPWRQSQIQRVSKGCFPAQWTKHFWRFQLGTEHSVHFGGDRGSWTDTSVFHMQQD